MRGRGEGGARNTCRSVCGDGSDSTASAGDYYVYSCSQYNNAAPAFSKLTGGSNWNLSNECDAGRSLEINQFSSVENGKGGAWLAYSPSPAITIVGATTPPGTVSVDCMLHTDGFQAFYAWSSGGSTTHQISYVANCTAANVAQKRYEGFYSALL